MQTHQRFFHRGTTWLVAAVVLLGLADVARQSIADRRVTSRVYRIGWQPDPPFQTVGPDGQASGLAINLVKEAARRAGIHLLWVLRPDGAEPALLHKRVDLWPFLTITPERANLFHITDPFLETELSILVPQSSSFTTIPDLAHATISLNDMAVNRRWIHSALPAARIVGTPSSHQALAEVCQGHVDAAFLEEYNAVETLLAGGACANVPLRWITVPGKISRLGVGSIFEASRAADTIRDQIGAMAAEGSLEGALGQWGYMSGLHLQMVQELLNAGRRETRLTVGIALFALVVALASWLAVRTYRERERALRAERAQRGTEDLLRLMADNLTQMVLAYDMNRRVTYANPASERLIGYTPEELLRAGFIDWTHPDDRERMLGLFAGLFNGQSFREVEYRLIAKDGTVKWANATWGPIRDESGRQVGVQGSERDITERKQAEESLRESERRFRGLLENAQLSALMVDIDGRITFCNDYVIAKTGYSREELVGHPVSAFMVPEERPHVDGLIAAVQQGTAPSHWVGEPNILAKNGKTRRFHACTMVLRDAQGKPSGLANIGFDITEHYALQEQYLQAQKMEGLGRLAGGVAHDFNNLLTVINGYSDIIFRRLRDGDPLRANVDQVRKAGTRAADLTRQLLTFSRKQVVQPKPLDLNLVAGDSEKMWERLLGKDVQLVTRLSRDLGLVMADAGQMHQVIMNLVVNARDAMSKGGTLVIETSNCEIDAAYAASNQEATEGPHVLLAVSDTGLGMDEETKRRIFEPFFTTKPVGEGTGLGLSTVFGIVKQSRGWIDVYTEAGVGTEFKIYLPRIPMPDTSASTPASPGATGACSETILLVEDQPEVRALARSILEDSGYRVLAAADGPSALALAESHSGVIDLLLTDVVLPGMSSRELAGRLIVMRPGVRVLFTSGYTQEAAALRAILDHGSAFLPKPYLPETLAIKVRELLNGPEASW